MKGFKDTTRVQYFRGGRVGEGREVEKACGGMVKKAEGGVVKGREKFSDDYSRKEDMRLERNKSNAELFGKHKYNTVRSPFRKTKTPTVQDVHDYLVNKPTKKAEGGRVTDPIKNKTGTRKDPEYGDYAIRAMTGAASTASERDAARKSLEDRKLRSMTGAASTASERRAIMKKAKGGAVVEKCSGEVYKSKAAMKRHEAKESPAMERAEHRRGPAARGKGVPSHNRAPMIKAK